MATTRTFRDSSSSSSGDEDDDFLHPSTDPIAEQFEDYNPRKRRRPGRDTKESAALGVFGDDSEDEDEDEVGVGGRRWMWKRKSLRGRGVAFVGGGGGKKGGSGEGEDEGDEDKEEKQAEGDVEEEEEQAERDVDVEMRDADKLEETAGLRGLGFGASRKSDWQSPTPKKNCLGTANGTPLGRGFVPSSAAIPVLLNQDEEKESTPQVVRPSVFSTPTAGKRGQKNGTPANAGSFAARMMAKMGYKEGQGLGKEGQGRSGVIEVQLRPQGVGLGAVAEKSKQEREEEKRQARMRGETVEDSDEERKKQRRKAKTSGASSGVSTPKKSIKPKFKTVEDIKKGAPGLHIPDAFAPILDMTAPGQRLLTFSSGLLTPTTSSESVEQIESRKLARRAQNDLSAFVEEWKNLEERKAYIEMEILQRQQEIEESQRDVDQLSSYAQKVDSMKESAEAGQWDPVLEALLSAESLELSAGVNEEMSNLAVAVVHPFLRQFTEGWQPLEDPKLNCIASSLSSIRHVLGATSNEKALAGPNASNGIHRNRTKTTAYESMVYKIIFPKIVSAINLWDVYNPTPLLALFDAWNDLLPAFVRSQMLDQALVSKLNAAVSSWNPRKRRSHELPHLWLFPWLQYLPTHHADPSSSTGLVSDVKRKSGHLIDAWDYRKGVIPGLSQWREVLQPRGSKDHWTPLIMNHVLPSMSKFLKNSQNFQVDPNDQSPYMASLQGILAWSEKGILQPQVVGQVMADTIFPMWQDVLYQWLTVVGPNEEIGQWFEWWRDEVFPNDIKSLPAIQNEFQKGHNMINHALDLGTEAANLLPAPSITAEAEALAEKALQNPPTKPIEVAPAPVIEETTFRHKVEDWCIDNDLQFLPEKKVLHSAGPLYRITAAANGKLGVLVYFKGDSLWAVQRRGGEQGDGRDVRIEWGSEDGRDALLGMAWVGVK